MALLHDMNDPANVRVWTDKLSGRERRACKPCQAAAGRRYNHRRRQAAKARRTLEWTGPRRIQTESWVSRHKAAGVTAARRNGQPMRYKPTAAELDTAQRIADGYSVQEIAVDCYLTTAAVNERLRRLNAKWGTNNRIAMIGQGLKRGLIQPDHVTAKHLLRQESRHGYKGPAFRTYPVVRYVWRLRGELLGECPPYPLGANAKLAEILWPLEARTEAHALSILWAARVITSRHIPQTRNNYRKHM
ncbi:hypothetical protein [Streptomyces sp. NPDC048611]|uniref:helix-turn-helix transcriptional regulator n=1 Tax=Streptomyces sp. NPDC048611 TaxID=3155635 RepID=UPI003415886F